jgi:hypothetical protein
MCTRIHSYHQYVYVCMHMCVCMHESAYMLTSIHLAITTIHIYMCVCDGICAYIHTYIHTYIPVCHHKTQVHPRLSPRWQAASRHTPTEHDPNCPDAGLRIRMLQRNRGSCRSAQNPESEWFLCLSCRDIRDARL